MSQTQQNNMRVEDRESADKYTPHTSNGLLVMAKSDRFCMG